MIPLSTPVDLQIPRLTRGFAFMESGAPCNFAPAKADSRKDILALSVLVENTSDSSGRYIGRVAIGLRCWAILIP